MGAFALEPFDFELLTTVSRPILMLWRSIQIDAGYGYGSLHTSMVTVMGSLPPSQIIEAMNHSQGLVKPFFENYYRSLGIDSTSRRAIVKYHFKESLRLSEGQDPSLYIAMANWIKANQENPQEDKRLFEDYLKRALAIKAEENISNRLTILIYQQQAKILLEKTEEFFF